MKTLKRLVLRSTLSVVLGLLTAVAAVAGGSVTPEPGPGTGTPNCYVNRNEPPLALIYKSFCKDSCTLSQGCCQHWVLRITELGGSYHDEDYRFCANTAYQCTTTSDPNHNICKDAYGHSADPDYPTAPN